MAVLFPYGAKNWKKRGAVQFVLIITGIYLKIYIRPWIKRISLMRLLRLQLLLDLEPILHFLMVILNCIEVGAYLGKKVV